MSLDRLRARARDFTAAPGSLTTRDFHPNVESTRAVQAPSAKRVGEFYDRNGRVLTDIFAGSMHLGYWLGPDDDSDLKAATERLTEIMIIKLRAGAGDTVLDLGCGTGKPAVRLARTTGARVVGISVSTEDVAQATALAQAEGVADLVDFRVADAMDLPFEAGSFDAVLALGSIPHILDRTHVLKQVAQVLRPGGRLALTDAIKRGNEVDEMAVAILNEVLDAWRQASPVRASDYRRFGREAGLVIDEITDITEHTKYTYRKIYAEMDAYGELPPDMVRIHDHGEGVDWVEVENGPQPDGMMIAVAHRP
ncbi:SAM-dependent methyltransferase [Streptosporangium amethystogenes subsp. fukuiense]|uniref:SAM-dependent methyltransferase n=1 Tax=Streptosporangium amethystogenes subsp. fukuiense TaxID=698418 RepID=A0ABW2T8Z9_9ACTN